MTTSSSPTLHPGTAAQAPLLSNLALRSKAFWGYDDAFLAACRGELTLDASVACDAVVAESGGTVTGFHLLAREPGRPFTGRLEMLFVEPSMIGTGIGRALLTDALLRAAGRGWTSLVLDADPGAEGFYLRLGASRVGESPSGSVVGRVLPVLELAVPRAQQGVADSDEAPP